MRVALDDSFRKTISVAEVTPRDVDGANFGSSIGDAVLAFAGARSVRAVLFLEWPGACSCEYERQCNTDLIAAVLK